MGVPRPRLVSPMWLDRVGAPFLTLFNRVTGIEPLYTGEALHALCASNPDVRHDKAAAEWGYTARPLDETLADLVAGFRARGMGVP